MPPLARQLSFSVGNPTEETAAHYARKTQGDAIPVITFGSNYGNALG